MVKMISRERTWLPKYIDYHYMLATRWLWTQERLEISNGNRTEWSTIPAVMASYVQYGDKPIAVFSLGKRENQLFWMLSKRVKEGELQCSVNIIIIQG